MWSSRPVPNPTPADVPVITLAFSLKETGTHAAWQSRLNKPAVPLIQFANSTYTPRTLPYIFCTPQRADKAFSKRPSH